MLNVLVYGWKDIQLVNEDGCCVATYESIETAKRAKALWNMAERLRLTTEEIESGNVEAKLKTAPDMLEALDNVYRGCWIDRDSYGPFVQKKITMEEYEAMGIAIKKARGEG